MSKTIHTYTNHTLTELFPIQYGKEKCESCHSFGPIKLENYLFHYIMSGSGTFYDTDRNLSYPVNAGEGFLIFPGQKSSYAASLENPWDYMWIEFNGMRAKKIVETIGLSPENPIYHPKSKQAEYSIYEKLMNIIQHTKQSEFYTMGQLYLFFDELNNNSNCHQTTHIQSSQALYLKEAVNFITRHYPENISSVTVAESLNISSSYLTRLFKSEYQLTPSHYIQEFRLMKGAELLQKSNLSIAAIAEQIGFSNQFYFSNVFKKKYHCSPSQYRKKSR
ncbi:AraC family transcriptional regulator [Aerococcaceae bacterium zg-ZJ1578]|uniref:AraC family transcriptional regulator n=1 Tax=Aerococcaceae bacterium zg-252 TaxID=2796928 RepID=UPI001A271A16|nr:AraC family transcriptional regulator [Aerococcaceae bacterium zg-1578]